MLKMEFPDLRNAASGRAKVDATNVTIDDLVKAFVELDKAISRFEETADSRMGMIAGRRCNDMIHLLTGLKQRINGVRRSITHLEREDPLEEDYLEPPVL